MLLEPDPLQPLKEVEETTFSDDKLSWEGGFALQILQSCHVLFSELDRIKQSFRAIGNTCRTERKTVEARIEDMVHVLRRANPPYFKQQNTKVQQGLLYTSQQTIRALREYVLALVNSSTLDVADGKALQRITMALHAMATKTQRSHQSLHYSKHPAEKEASLKVPETRELGNTATADNTQKSGSATTVRSLSHKQTLSKSSSGSGSNRKTKHRKRPQPRSEEDVRASEPTIREALKKAASLAELLRIFTRVSQQSWITNRSQLSHAPSVPSPLAPSSSSSSGGGKDSKSGKHRRWASENIETTDTPILLGNKLALTTAINHTSQSAVLHARNRSDSRILQTGEAGNNFGSILRRPATTLSQRRPSPTNQPQVSSLLTNGNNEPAGGGSEKSKQVRFSTTTTATNNSNDDGAINQTHLSELNQHLLNFEKAVSTVKETLDNHQTNLLVQTIRSLASSFLQLSRHSSTAGMVRHYDRQVLAQFKEVTQAVKQLMAICSNS